MSLANNNYDTIVLANCEGTTCSFEVLRGDELDFSGTSGKQFHIVGCNIKEKYCNYLLENIELKNSEAEDAISRTSLPLEWYAAYHDLLEKIHSSIIEVNKCSSSVSLSLTNDSVFDNFLDQNAQKTRDQFIKENIPNYYHFEKSRSDKPKISLEYSEDFPFKVSVGYFNEFKSDYNKIDSIKEFLRTKDYRRLYYGLFGAEWVFTHAFMEIHQIGGEKAL